MDPLIVLVAFVALGVTVRVMAGVLDQSRIQGDLAERGATVERIAWTPFARGWLGRKGERTYEVEFTDAEGSTRVATCSTSMLAGVYYRDERVTGPAAPPPAREGAPDADLVAALLEENARLREEIDRLRSG